MRSLNAYIDNHRVGTLSEGEDIWCFDYDAQWAQAPSGFDLAPGLPRSTLCHRDGSTTRPVQWFFDNLLPEGATLRGHCQTSNSMLAFKHCPIRH